MKLQSKLLLVVVIVTAASVSQAQDYAKILKNAIKQNLGNDLRGYQIFDYPTDNFGLITCYKKNTKDKNFECDMFSCIGIDSANSAQADWLMMDGFAAKGDGGGTITLDQNVQNQLGIDFILPKIFSIVGLTSKLDKDKIANLKLTLGPIVMRKLRKGKMQDYLMHLPTDSWERQLFNSGEMVLIVSDCVIQNMDVDITLKDTSSTDIDIRFGWKGSTIAAKILDSASVGVKVVKQAAGTYKFSLTHPVIFARLSSKQPQAGTLSDISKEYFEDWDPIDQEQVVDPEKLQQWVKSHRK